MKKAQGFTLTELAISLVIISLMVGGGMVTVGALLDRAAYQETDNKLDQFRRVILGFSSRTQRLPKYTGTTTTDDEVTPNIPTNTDFWDKKIVYLYDPELARIDFPSAICSKRSTNLTVRNCPDLACTTYTDIQNVAFAYFSSGKNLINQTDSAESGVLKTEPSPYLSYSGPVGGFGTANLKVVKKYGQGYPVGIYSDAANNKSAYDDRLEYLTLDELRQHLGCSAKPLKLVNLDLPMGAQGASYRVDVIAEGGVPIHATQNFRWCIESTDALIDDDLVFQIRQRNGNDYATPLTTTALADGTCTLSTTLETSASWVTGDMLRVVGKTGGSLAALGGARTRNFKIYVRDNQNNDATLTTHDNLDNIESRTFVVAIHGT